MQKLKKAVLLAAKSRGVTLNELCLRLGIKASSYHRKWVNSTIKVRDLLQIAEILDADIVIKIDGRIAFIRDAEKHHALSKSVSDLTKKIGSEKQNGELLETVSKVIGDLVEERGRIIL